MAWIQLVIGYITEFILLIEKITRLISIVSKPIKVVFVDIVVVVFVKQKLCPKIFDPKIIHVQKTLGLEVLDPK